MSTEQRIDYWQRQLKKAEERSRLTKTRVGYHKAKSDMEKAERILHELTMYQWLYDPTAGIRR